MRKRIMTGVVLAGLLFLAISLANAWPLRIGLAMCFGVAAFEIAASAGRGRLAEYAMKVSEIFKMRMFLQFILLLIAGCAVLTNPIGPMELMAVIIATYTADIGGYFVGKRYGRQRVQALANISPNKTVEGFVGAIVLSLAVTGIYVFAATGSTFRSISTPNPMPLFGLWMFGGAVACVGDLLGSATKRELGIKDADDITKHMPGVQVLERLMTGHGGYLDRFDSLCLVMVFYYLLLMIVGALG